MARPSTLTPEIADKIVAVVAGGGRLEAAAAAAGVPRSTFYDWRRRGKNGDGPGDACYRELRERVEQAREANAAVLQEQLLAELTDPRLAARMLELIAPERWGEQRTRLRRW